jgi:7-cyano-7-deazaguanine synthase
VGTTLEVDYKDTVSCYSLNDKGEACGKCDSCIFRRQGFADSGIDDPTVYEKK